MKKYIIVLALGLSFFSSIYGQIMVVSQNKVRFSSVKEYNELSEKHWYPIFNKLVDEGKLIEFGAPCVHFYTMGKSDNVQKIVGNFS